MVLVRYSACFIPNYKNILSMSTGQSLGILFCGSNRRGEPLLGMVFVEYLLFRPLELDAEDRIHVPQPLRKLAPQNIIKLVLGRRRADNLRHPPGAQIMQTQPGRNSILAAAMAGNYTHISGPFIKSLQHPVLLPIRGHVQNFRKESPTVVVVILDHVEKLLRLVHYTPKELRS